MEDQFNEEELPKWVYVLLFIFTGFAIATGLYFLLPFLWNCIIGLVFCVLMTYVWLMILL